MGFMFLFIFTFFLFVLFVCSWWVLVVLMVWWVWFILKILVSELISLFFQYFMNIFNEILFIDEINFFQIIIRCKIIVLIIQFIETLADVQIIKLLLRLIELLDQCFIILHHYFNVVLFRLDKINDIFELCMQFSLILWIFVFGNFNRFTYKKIFILIIILI
jgi:hypothetical protein